MSESTTTTSTTQGGGCGCGGCGCGGAAAGGARQEGLQVVAAPTRAEAAASAVQPGDMDVRSMPPAQRHAQVFAAVGALLPGEAFVLANDHDPLPLRYQLDAEQPGQITWEYLAQGPDVWRVLISRQSCC